MKESLTYYDVKAAKSSIVFESEVVRGCSAEEISEGERMYAKILDRLNSGEDIDEGLFGALIGGTAGALVGPAIGKAVCRALGIEESGTLGKLLTSRLVTAAIGASLGK